jgi:anti-sigma regulatory factor (Ser/Thr protein kinase)
VIVDLCRSFHLGGEVESRMFTVLSELFQNALEHGLLGLDSALKSEPDGFERYLERRAQRLAALAQGEIAVRVEHRALDSGTQRVQIVVRDTGKGFDHVEHLARLTTASSADPLLLPSGRGIGLLYKLCDAVAFNASGNETRVEFGYG